MHSPFKILNENKLKERNLQDPSKKLPDFAINIFMSRCNLFIQGSNTIVFTDISMIKW